MFNFIPDKLQTGLLLSYWLSVTSLKLCNPCRHWRRWSMLSKWLPWRLMCFSLYLCPWRYNKPWPQHIWHLLVLFWGGEKLSFSCYLAHQWGCLSDYRTGLILTGWQDHSNLNERKGMQKKKNLRDHKTITAEVNSTPLLLNWVIAPTPTNSKYLPLKLI